MNSESQEYRAVLQWYPKLVDCIKQAPTDLAVQLRPSGILAGTDWEFLINPERNKDLKAIRIVDVVLIHIKDKPQGYSMFISALKAAGSWTETIVSELERTHTSLLADSELQQANNTSSQSTVPISASSFQSSVTYSVQSNTTSDSAPAHGQEPSTSPPAHSTTTPPQSTSSVNRRRTLIQEFSHSDPSDDESQSSHSPSIARSTSETSSHSRANSPASDSQQSSYLQFECGCEQCSVYDYISGNICPNPKQLPFPKLKVSQFPPEEIKFIEEELRDQTRSIHFKFCSLVSNTFKELSKNVDHAELISHLKICLESNWISPYAHSASKSLKVLEDVKFSDLPKHLMDRCYCSWFDYGLIKHLREHYLFPSVSDEDKALKNYKEYLRCYVRQRCFIYFHNTGPLPKNCIEVVCKVDLQYGELCQKLIDHLKHVFTKIIGASKYHLVFMRAKKGCTELTFGAPPYFSEIIKLSKYQVSQLKDHGFIQVTINERNLLQCKDHQGSELGTIARISEYENSLVGGGYLKDPLTSIEGSDSGSIQEADIDTTDSKLTCTEIQVEVSYYNEILNTVCEKEIELKEEMQFDVSRWSLRKALHDGEPFMALVYNSRVEDKVLFSEFIDDLLIEKQNVLKASCVHLDDTLSDNPILLFEPEQSLKDYCTTSEVISEVDQLTILRDVAIGTIGFLPHTKLRLKVTVESIFVHKESKGEIRAYFSPLYQHSYFPNYARQDTRPSADYEWVKTSLLLMHYRDRCDEHTELPEEHILYNIFKYKWFSEEESLHPKDIIEIAKEIAYIRDLEQTRLEMIHSLSSSDVLEVSHLHMILIGHTGVGKTSIRKHLQNIPFNAKEKSTVIMEQELLCQVTIEASTDSASMVFQKSENVYKSEPDKVFLTLWDTGGQPMFQDLLPCFAKLRSIYGVCFRLCDLLENRTALVRPVSSLECERESPYSCVDYIYRCLAFLDSFSPSLLNNFGNIPFEVKNISFESTELHTFPRLALLGTFKDTVREDDSLLKERFSQLRETIDSFQFDFLVRALLPETKESIVFELDNTRSGQKHEDPGMMDLRKQIVACTQSAKAKVPSVWISFKVDLEHESQLQQPCTGIVTFAKATEIAKKYKIGPKPALCYFHELGIFLWYREEKSLNDYIIIEPKNFVSILGTILNPERFVESHEQWEQLQTNGIVDTQIANQLLDGSRTGLPLEWVFSFFEKHHLAISLQEGYFIPSMLQVLPICPNYLHICNIEDSVCTFLSKDIGTEVAPIFLVSRSLFIPPGFFPRFMTMLAGIQNGRIVWKLSSNSNSCKNIVSLVVNNQALITFTEFLKCIRVQLELISSRVDSGELCRRIVAQLKVQLQRVFPQVNVPPVSITFACFCSKIPHFLPSLPSTTKDEMHCSVLPETTFELTKSHEIWLKSPPEITSDKDAEELFETALEAGLVGLRVSTVLFVGTEDSSYTEMLFGETGELSKYSSKFYLVDGQEIVTLKPDYLNYFFACNAMVPQEAGLENKISQEQSLTHDIDEGVDERRNEHTPQGLAHELSELPSEILEMSSQSPPESSDKEIPNKKSSTAKRNDQKKKENTLQGLAVQEPETSSNHDLNMPFESANRTYKSTSMSEPEESRVASNETISVDNGLSTTRTSDPERSKNVLTETSGNVLKLMSEASEEKHSLQLIHAIECNNLSIPILPLILQSTITFGVGYTECTEILKTVQHLSKKWLIIKSKETNVEISKAFHSIKTPFETDISLQPKVSARDIALLSYKTEEKVIPYAWYFLCYTIQNAFKEINRKVMNMDEVSDIAKKCHISVDELPAVLSCLHKSGFLLYYRDILPNVIFKDASLIIKILTSAILDSCKIATSYDGFIHESCLTQYAHVEGLLILQDVIKLLQNLSIIAPVGTQLFYMPTLLTKVPDESLLSRHDSVSPLHVLYPAAPGVFEYLLCYLTSEQNEELWPWKICTDWSNQRPTCLYRNCAELTLPGYDCIIMLLQSSDCITVYVEVADNQPPFAKIRESIVTGVKRAFRSYHYPDTEIKLGFSCTCDSVDFEHTMVYHEQDQCLKCPHSSNEEAVLPTYNQKMWIEEVIPEDKDALSVSNVFRFYLLRYKEWYQVGLELGLTTEVLENISGQYREEPDVALMEAIKHWFICNPNPTWESIRIDAAKTTSPPSNQPSDTTPSPSDKPASPTESVNTKEDEEDTEPTSDDMDALQKVLQSANVKLAFAKLTLEKAQQLLIEKGLEELAANLRAKLDKVLEEQEQYLRRLEDLMTDKDTMDIRCLKVFLVGPPGVGKTTTLNRLLKTIQNISTSAEEYQSTLLADCIQVIAFLSENATEWLSSRDANEETKMVFGLVHGTGALKQVSSKLKSQDKPKQKEEPASSIEKEKPLELPIAKEPQIQYKQSPKLPRQPVQPQPEPTKTERRAIAHQQSRLIPIKARLQKLIKTGDYSKIANLLGDTLLNINDIGGQPGFLEMLPALSTGPAMYLVFLDLSKELNKPYEIPFSRDATIITPFKAVHTVEATISQILSAIASVHSLSRDLASYKKAAEFIEKFDKFQQVSPVATVIGTHKDQLTNPEEEMKAIDECLKKVTQKFKATGILVSPTNASLFSVDNYAGTEQSDIGPIREFMNNIFRTHFKDASLPIRPKWLIFGTVLRREYKIVKMEDCLEIGKILKMDEGEIDFCLWYLDCIGSLMHYTNIADDEDDWFKNHVICSPQVIFDSTSQLIVASLCTIHLEGYVIDRDKEELIKKGQFSIESIEKYCFCEEVTKKIQSEELIPVKQLVKLLNHANLLSPITHTKKDGSERITYLMPAVLECATLDELSPPTSPDANNPEPLLITFSCGYVPTGTFCGLITRLVSLGPHGILGIEWDLVEEGVKRNCVSFYVDFANRVTLICHDRFYEIRVQRKDPQKSLHDICTYVLSVIFYTLNSIFENLSPQIAFQCSCPKHALQQVIRDLCFLAEGKTFIRFLCERTPVTLTPAQRVWLGKLVAPSSRAKLEVLKYAEDVFSYHWTKEGSRRQIKTTSEPNVLSFQSVSEEDLGYYRCELREAGKVVLTVYRALYKDESTKVTKLPQSVAAPARVPSQVRTSQLGPLRKALWEVRAKWEDIGIDLGISLDTLEAIDTEHRGRVERCFTALLTEWLQGDPQMEDLLESLRGPVVDRPALADQLEEKIKTGKIKW